MRSRNRALVHPGRVNWRSPKTSMLRNQSGTAMWYLQLTHKEWDAAETAHAQGGALVQPPDTRPAPDHTVDSTTRRGAYPRRVVSSS